MNSSFRLLSIAIVLEVVIVVIVQPNFKFPKFPSPIDYEAQLAAPSDLTQRFETWRVDDLPKIVGWIVAFGEDELDFQTIPHNLLNLGQIARVPASKTIQKLILIDNEWIQMDI